MEYRTFGVRLKDDPGSVSDADAGKVLATIEKEIDGSPDWKTPDGASYFEKASKGRLCP